MGLRLSYLAGFLTSRLANQLLRMDLKSLAQQMLRLEVEFIFARWTLCIS